MLSNLFASYPLPSHYDVLRVEASLFNAKYNFPASNVQHVSSSKHLIAQHDRARITNNKKAFTSECDVKRTILN